MESEKAREKKKDSVAPLVKSYEVLISLVIGLILLALQVGGALQRFELSTLDLRFLLRGIIPTDPRVLYVEMAEDGIANIGRWPWSRDWHATFLSVVDGYKPAAVVFDVFFTEPSQDSEADDALAEAIGMSKKVYLPILPEGLGQDPQKRLDPLEKFRQGMRGTGHISMVPDKDGVVRRVPLYIERNGELIPQLSFQVALDTLGIRKEDIQVIPGKWILLNRKDALPIRIPIDQKYQMIINWAGPWNKTFQHVSYYETLAACKQLQENQKPMLDLALYKDKIALVGLTATGLFDTKPIPFESLHPMVGVHGNILSNIFRQNFLRMSPAWLNGLLTLAFALYVGLIIHYTGPFKGAFLSTLLLVLGAAGTCVAFVWKGFIIDTVAPAMAVTFSYLAIVLYRYMTEEKKKRWIKMAFAHYLAPAVIEEILKNPDQLKLGGQRQVLTVLFSDVRSFTTFSEAHTPEQVVHMLNEYLDAMTQVILKNRGTVDKFVGDEIMAIFGAPVPMDVKTQAYLAVKTALEMLEGLKTLHAKWQAEGKPLLGMGVGINTGEMICGNMGSKDIFDYTVIGDNVNIGARVEALTRKFNCDVIVTESTYDLIASMAEVEKLEPIVVKGKTRPITIYAVRGLKASLDTPIVTAK